MKTESKERLKRIALVTLSLLLALALCEGILFILGFKPSGRWINPSFKDSWAAPDLMLGWVNKDGTYKSTEQGQAPMTFKDLARNSNNQNKAEGRNIALLGCSLTQGYGLPDEDTFACILNQKSPDNFTNYGTAAYSTIQSFILMQRIMSANRTMDAFVYFYAPHHQDRNVALKSWVKGITDSQGRHALPPHAVIHDGIVSLREYKVIDKWPLEDMLASVALLKDVYLTMRLHGREETKKEVTFEIIREMNIMAKANKKKFAVIVLWPVNSNLDPEENKELFAFLRKNDIPYHDCSIPDIMNSDWYICPGCHPNRKASEYWADCILNYLYKQEKPLL